MASSRELFAQQGPQAQMDEIAAHAGVGIGTVYRHFPTKEALLTAMVRDRFQEFAEIATLAEDILDPLEALESIIRSSAEAVEGDAGFQLAMMGSDAARVGGDRAAEGRPRRGRHPDHLPRDRRRRRPRRFHLRRLWDADVRNHRHDVLQTG